jgi:type I restriction-modification system DNA methylase subunit
MKTKTETMNSTTKIINNILGVDDIFKAPAKMLEILLDRGWRENIFFQFLESFKHKLHEDFFHNYFQEEIAQRKEMKQDFTPVSVSGLVTQLVDESGMYFEACAGTGGMMIAQWEKDRCKHNPFHPQIKHKVFNPYKPSDYLYVCEELSDRAFPFLVFNMAIRGLNGAAIHCDSLTRECYGVFFIQNDDDNPIGFSSVNVMPYSKEAESYFNVKFIEEKYPAYIESPNQFICKEKKYRKTKEKL